MYKELIKKVSLYLKSIGFEQKADTFYINKANNWGLINFQKSRSSTSFVTLFTINLGISSSILREAAGINLSKKPAIEECHWNERIGFLLDQKEDFWWKIEADTNLDKLSAEIVMVLNKFAIAEIDKHIKDESLESEWLNGKGAGLTDLQIYVNLTTLLKLKGSDILPKVIETIRKDIDKKSCKNSFKIHLKELLG